MSCSLESARDFFALHKDGGDLAKKIQDLPCSVQIAWEQIAVCADSPGPVVNTELLLRQIVCPVHFDFETNEVKPNLFEDAISKGASIHRLSHTTEEKIVDIAQQRVYSQNINPPKTGPRTLIGYVSIAAHAARAVRVDVEGFRERQVLAIYDTANDKDQSHADICLLRRQKQAEISVKSQLYLLAKGSLKRISG